MPKYPSSPTHSFTIPSIYDGTQLSCRIYLPQQLTNPHAASPWRVQGAIVAHPYASLGGSYDDPVVSFIGGELLEAGYVVGTFNFRGAGDSGGQTSWTAKPELADYVSFYGFMLLYLHCLRSNILFRSEESNVEDGIYLILGGYSYGSLVASHLPASDVIVEIFRDGTQGAPVHEISLTAKNTCALSEDKIPPSTLVQDPEALSSWQNAKDPLQSINTTTSHLLISPLLPPINLFLTLFLDLSLEVDTEASGQRRKIPCPKPSDQLCAHRTLAIYGDEDTFTSASKLRNWSDELSNVPQSQFASKEVEGAGHFWREPGAEQEARQSLRLWLRQRL
ncbi:Alpha/Beta hydrolase protein [Aspergillus crustosus]